MMVAGSVSVDDDGNVTATPDDATNAALGLFNLLVAAESSDPDMMPVPPHQYVTPASATYNVQTGELTVTPSNMPTTEGDVPKMPVPPETSGSPAALKGKAKLANTMGSWLVTYLTANAVVTVTIPNAAAGDGLQTSASAGNPTTRPATAKTISGVLT